MKTIQDKYLVVGADFAGFPLKEVVVEHLQKKGWKITDLGVTADSDPDDTENMFHRVGLRVGAQISEGIFERALLFLRNGHGDSYRGKQMSACARGRSGERTRRASGNHGKRSKRACHGCGLCGAADGVRYSGCVFRSRFGQRL